MKQIREPKQENIDKVRERYRSTALETIKAQIKHYRFTIKEVFGDEYEIEEQ